MFIKELILRFIKKIKDAKPVKCTECGEVYEPTSSHSDIRCANCGCHQEI